jgi:hypothetical protein
LRIGGNPPLGSAIPSYRLQPVTIPTALRRRRPAVLLATVLAALPLALAACGGSGGEQDAEALLDRAFSEPVPSADVEIDAQLEVDGLRGFGDPLRIRASGPYVREKDKLPQLDMDLEIGTPGAGQAIQAGILSTGDRVFLKFGGAYFEQSQAQIATANRRLAKNGSGGGSLSDLGLDARGWIVDASVAGEEEIGGVTVEHVEGTLDVEALLTDLNGLVKRSAGALGASGDTPQALGKDDIERLSRSVDDPSFDVYVGKDDDIVRRVSLNVHVDVPEGDREDVNGITGASVRLSAELSDIGGDQRVEAPRVSRPISDLSRQLGGLSALTGTGGLEGTATTPDASTDGSDPSGDGGTTTDGTTTDDGGGSDDFERYGQCLEQARPDDAPAIARCSQLVTP